MSETKHTPGPWYALPARAGFYIQAENDIIVDTADQNARYGTIDNEANAFLIAAAPELLEALKVFIEYSKQGGPLSFDTDAMWAQARAAIAKAEGAQP